MTSACSAFTTCRSGAPSTPGRRDLCPLPAAHLLPRRPHMPSSAAKGAVPCPSYACCPNVRPPQRTAAAARQRALLGAGRQTPGQLFWTVLDAAGQPVGTLWVWLDEDAGRGAHLSYIVIGEARRGRGFGAALAALEAEAARQRHTLPLPQRVRRQYRGAAPLSAGWLPRRRDHHGRSSVTDTTRGRTPCSPRFATATSRCSGPRA